MPGVESRLLAQARLTTSPVSIYQPQALTIGVIKHFVIANTSSGNVTYRIFIDIDGGTFDEDSSIFWDVALSGNAFDTLPAWLPMGNTAQLGVQADTADALTITVGGYEIAQDEVFAERPLGQVRPGTSGVPVSIFSPASGVRGVVRSLAVSNVAAGGKAATYSIFLDHGGTTYDDTTALASDVTLSTGTTDVLPLYMPMEDAAGNLAVETGDGASEVNFTAFGFLEVL